TKISSSPAAQAVTNGTNGFIDYALNDLATAIQGGINENTRSYASSILNNIVAATAQMKSLQTSSPSLSSVISAILNDLTTAKLAVTPYTTTTPPSTS